MSNSVGSNMSGGDQSPAVLRDRVCKNVDTGTVPAHAVVQLKTGIVQTPIPGQYVFQAGQVEDTCQLVFISEGGRTVPNQTFRIAQSYPTLVLYDKTSGTPVFGQEWGPEEGNWAMVKGGLGWICCGILENSPYVTDPDYGIMAIAPRMVESTCLTTTTGDGTTETPTTQGPTTTPSATTTADATTQSPTTTVSPTTTAQATTTGEPTTTASPTTTGAPTTTDSPTTTGAPTTTAAATTTGAATTSTTTADVATTTSGVTTTTGAPGTTTTGEATTTTTCAPLDCDAGKSKLTVVTDVACSNGSLVVTTRDICLPTDDIDLCDPLPS